MESTTEQQDNGSADGTEGSVELREWAVKLHAFGHNLRHATDPWRELPWPKKMVGGGAVTGIVWWVASNWPF